MQPLCTYVMENILFKMQYPAEFHAQTAVECAIAVHFKVKIRIAEIQSIIIFTQEQACALSIKPAHYIM